MISSFELYLVLPNNKTLLTFCEPICYKFLVFFVLILYLTRVSLSLHTFLNSSLYNSTFLPLPLEMQKKGRIIVLVTTLSSDLISVVIIQQCIDRLILITYLKVILHSVKLSANLSGTLW